MHHDLKQDTRAENQKQKDRMITHYQSVTSLRRHDEQLPDEDKNNYFDEFTPNDDFFDGGCVQSTSLRWMIYLDKHCKGFKDCGMDLAIYQGFDFDEVPHL